MGDMQGALHLRVWLKLLPAENPNTDNIVNGANIHFVYLYTIIDIYKYRLFQVRMLKQQGIMLKAKIQMPFFLSWL